jgi:hypothetical protein
MNEFIARKGIISLDGAQVTGSLSVTGNISASIFSGSFVGDGSQLSGVEGFPYTGSAGITGSLTVVGPVNATTFTGDGSQLTGIEGFPFTGSARITGSLTVVGPVNATSFTGSLQGIATSASYIQLANIDGFTAYSASVNTAIDNVLDATTPLTATVNTGSSPFTLTSQSIVVADSTDGNLTINLPDLNTIVGTPNQKPIIVYKNDYSQNVIYVNPSGSQLVNGSTQDIIVSIQLAVIYNPTSAGWVTEGTSAQSLAELELFFLPLTETGSLATTGSNTFIGNQTVTGSLTVTGGINATITGSATSASYVEYTNVANKPALVSSSAQIVGYNVFATTGSNSFNGSQVVTGSLTVTGQVVAQTLNVQQVTSSIVYSSGSNIFGNSVSNTQQFTGSLQVSGSSHYVLGNVGVGVTSPLSRFHVNTGTDQNFRVRPGTDVGATNGVALNSRTDDDGSLQQLALRASDVIMLPSSNIGVGTNDPQSILNNFSTNARGLAISNTYPFIGLNDTDGGNFYVGTQANLAYMWNGGSDAMVFATNNSEKMRITSAGNVIIGGTSYSMASGYTGLGINNATNGGALDLLLNDVKKGELYITSTSFNMYGFAGVGLNLTVDNNASKGLFIATTGAATFSSSATTNGAKPQLYVNGDSGNGAGIYLNTSLSGANRRNWAIFTEENVDGDFAIKCSTAAGGSPGSGNTRLQISRDGNVGIGTTTPSQKLEVVGGEIKAGRVDSSSEGGQLSFGRASDNATGWYIDVYGNTSTPDLRFVDVSNSAVRMTITSGGEVLVGQTSLSLSANGWALQQGGTGHASFQITNNEAFIFNNRTTGTTAQIDFRTNTVERGAINITDSGVTYTSVSDYRIKEDLQPINGLEKVNAIKVYNFKFKETGTRTDGVLAHELQEVLPYAVQGEKDGRKLQGVDYSKIVPVLVKAIQEQQSQIESLKAEIQTLKQ